MKTFLAIGKLLGGLLALLAFIGFFLPPEVHIEETIRVNADPARCFYMLQDLENWKNWSGIVPDSNNGIRVKEAADGSRNWLIWESEPGSLNRGFIRLQQSIPHAQIHLTFQAGNLGPAKSRFLLRPFDKGTEITWTFEVNPGLNPYAKLRALIWERHVHRIYSEGLIQFAKQVNTYETPPFKATYSWGEIPAGNRIFVQRYGVSSLQIASELQKVLGEIQLLAAENKWTILSPPWAIFENRQAGKQDFQAGFYIQEKIPGHLPLPFQSRSVSAKPALVCHFQGNSSLTFLMETDMLIRLQAEKKTPAGPLFEFYLTDPVAAKNPLDIKTDIFLPYQSAP